MKNIYLSIHTNEVDGMNHKSLVEKLKEHNVYWYKGPPYEGSLINKADMVILVPLWSEKKYIIGNGMLREMTKSSNKDIPTFWYDGKEIQNIVEVKLQPKVNGKFVDWLAVGEIVNNNQPLEGKIDDHYLKGPNVKKEYPLYDDNGNIEKAFKEAEIDDIVNEENIY